MRGVYSKEKAAFPHLRLAFALLVASLAALIFVPSSFALQNCVSTHNGNTVCADITDNVAAIQPISLSGTNDATNDAYGAYTGNVTWPTHGSTTPSDVSVSLSVSGANFYSVVIRSGTGTCPPINPDTTNQVTCDLASPEAQIDYVVVAPDFRGNTRSLSLDGEVFFLDPCPESDPCPSQNMVPFGADITTLVENPDGYAASYVPSNTNVFLDTDHSGSTSTGTPKLQGLTTGVTAAGQPTTAKLKVTDPDDADPDDGPAFNCVAKPNGSFSTLIGGTTHTCRKGTANLVAVPATASQLGGALRITESWDRSLVSKNQTTGNFVAFHADPFGVWTVISAKCKAGRPVPAQGCIESVTFLPSSDPSYPLGLRATMLRPENGYMR